MTINKFQGKTKEEAIEKAKAEFGENAVIMNVKEIKPKGLFRTFQSSTYEVTAAMEEREQFVSPARAMQNPKKLHESINLTADEEIDLTLARRQEPQKERMAKPQPQPQKLQPPKFQQLKPQQVKAQPPNHKSQFQLQQTQEIENQKMEKRLEDLSNRLEESFAGQRAKEQEQLDEPTAEALNFVRILYSTLLQNEVNEKYVNQILDEIEKFIRPGNGVDMILSNVYQKLILRFGQPKTIEMGGNKPRVLFFIGPTGVGKTTTIAKIASKYKVESEKKVAFITADTYRIAATEQLQVYANILDVPMDIAYSAEEMNDAIIKFADYDLVFVDTAGFSHKNQAQREDIRKLISGVSEEFDKEIYLVLSATTKYKDLLDIVDVYKEFTDYKLIFTKLDETTTYGNLLNIKLYSGADLSYMTTGQNVPDDIEVFDTQKIVKQLLGGNT